AWLMAHYKNQIIPPQMMADGFNPFIGIMPAWFKLAGIIISTIAAVIASQALISGSFTLISEAMRLNLWPKMKINYPTEEKGQL
ncbi:KUP/HAK/KT family potassium transporter, partial [Streptomyces brasiliscabiei]|uniref:KUP/HAK/KT family potassium transporter n=1 Tax=Streptomyces brasiliscabiei TaxID=2736302 RepID=UPI0038F6730B